MPENRPTDSTAPTPPDLSRFDTDPDAIEWARAKILRYVERAEQFEKHARDAGNPEMAAHWRITATFMRRTLLGGRGCVIAAFDARLPAMTRAMDGEAPR